MHVSRLRAGAMETKAERPSPGMSCVGTLLLLVTGLACADVHWLHAVGRRGRVNLRLEPGSRMIIVGHVLLERFQCGRFDEVDGAAAKSAARHACADDPGLRRRHFHQKIEFLAAYLVVVAEAAMRV